MSFAEMADPVDNMEEEMYELINSGANQDLAGDDNNNQEVDDGSQYFADYEEIMQENTGEVYTYNNLYVHMKF